MKLYIRKIDNQCIKKQISYTKEILKDFFDNQADQSTITCIGKNSGQQTEVKLLLATDPRFDHSMQRLLKEEGGLAINDLMVMYKHKTMYEVELIKPSDNRYNTLLQTFNNNDRHILMLLDDSSSAKNNSGYDDTFQRNPYGLHIKEQNDAASVKLCFKTSLKSGMARNRIVFGAPGTGKSYTLEKERKELLFGDKDFEENKSDLSLSNQYERVTFHPDYSYANFVGTYKPVPDKDDNGNDVITYAYVPGPFMRIYVNALKNSYEETPKPYLLIIEEINRANAAAVFGDIFQLLDRKENVSEYPIHPSEDVKKYLASELGGQPSDYHEIRIPDNMFIWATMNSADQGVYPMDTAFKRRWDFTYIGINENESGVAQYNITIQDKQINWNKLRKAINDYLSSPDINVNEDKLIGPYFLNTDALSDSKAFSDAFKSKILMYLFEDAAKHRRAKLFEGCKNNTLYSAICEEFDKTGIDIFNKKILEEYNRI